MMNLRKRIFLVLQPHNGRGSNLVGFFILGLIALNLLSVILESIASLQQAYGPLFDAFETVSVVLFTAEYLLRLWTCAEDPRYSRPVLGRLRAAASPMMLIDLLAILPFYLPFIDADLRFLRSLRLLRIFRLAKIARYSNALQTLGRVLGNHKIELAATGFVMFILLILSSTLMYYAENDAQPQAFSSVPASMWWAVATMTTVGYGDMCPVTPLGKVLGSFIAILGIGMFAIPTGIFAGGFAAEMRKRRKAPVCPHCGKELKSPAEAHVEEDA